MFDCEIAALGLNWEPGVTWTEFDTPEVEPYETVESLPDDLQDYLRQRGDEYGISVQEILDKVPDVLKNHPDLIHVFVQSKHISHIVPLSLCGSPSDPNNWIFEDGPPNMARGAEVMTDAELVSVAADKIWDAHVLIDLVCNKALTLETLLEHQDVVEEVFNSTTYTVSPADVAKAGLKTAFAIA